MSRERLLYLDGLKGVAILMVIAVHTMIIAGSEPSPQILQKIVSFGPHGVQLFFIVSTYLALVSFDHRKCGTITWVITRLLRIIPVYYIAIFVYYNVIGGYDFWLSPGEDGITYCNMFTHLFCIHGLFPSYINSIINVEWYIGTLVVLFWCIPFLHKIVNTYKKTYFFLIASIFLSVIIPKVLLMLFTASYLYRYLGCQVS